MARSSTSRLRPRFDRRWLIGLAVALVVVVVVRSIPERITGPPLHLVALGPDGSFRDTLPVPASWRDTTAAVGTARVPLVLGVRNTGERAGRPARLSLSLPARYRLVDPDGGMEAGLEVGSPLVTYTMDTGLKPVEPGRLPTLLPAVDTVWLEVVIPSFHCVTLGDSVPEFIPAPSPPMATMSDVRIFYSFEGGDLPQRRTGMLTVRLDTALLDVEMPEPPPSFPVVTDTALATPDVGELRFAGSRRSECGDPQAPVVLQSTLWLTEQGGRVLVLEHGGTVRKRLYDLDADGVVERESWDANGDGTFEATRRTRLPTPEFLLPVGPVRATRDSAARSG